MSKRACISVEFIAGSDISECIAEAKELAQRLEVAYVKFTFNTTKLCIGANADVSAAVEEYKYTPDKYIICS